jgi:hypothetical protein
MGLSRGVKNRAVAEADIRIFCLAADIIDSGRAKEKLEALVKFTSDCSYFTRNYPGPRLLVARFWLLVFGFCILPSVVG